MVTLYGRLCSYQEVWPYSYLIRVLHDRFKEEFSTLYCCEIKDAEIAQDAHPICMHTYEKGAENITTLLLDAKSLLASIPEDEKHK